MQHQSGCKTFGCIFMIKKEIEKMTSVVFNTSESFELVFVSRFIHLIRFKQEKKTWKNFEKPLERCLLTSKLNLT